jgi:hypothetical protein
MNGMSSIAMRGWVAFLKQPYALSGRAPPPQFFFVINDLYFFEFLLNFFVWVALSGRAGCFKKATQTPNAGHPKIYYSLKSNEVFI